MKNVITLALIALAIQSNGQSSYFGKRIQHTTAVGNIVDNTTIITGTVGDTAILATHNYSINSTYFNKPFGVWHDNINWNIYDESISTLNPGIGFNVLQLNNVNNTVIKQISTATNCSFNLTTIDHLATNNQPNAMLFVTHNYNNTHPNYNTHPYGVYYNGSKWNVFLQDPTLSMPLGLEFSVLAVPSSNANAFVHSTAAANILGNVTRIDHPKLNNNPNAQIQVTPSWKGGIYNNKHVGVFYDVDKWAIYNEDLSAMPIGASFNVLIPENQTPTSLQSSEENEFKISCVPNPAHNNVTIEIKDVQEAQVLLISSVGQIVKKVKPRQNSNATIDVSDLPNGMYIVKLVNDAEVLNTTLKIEH